MLSQLKKLILISFFFNYSVAAIQLPEEQMEEWNRLIYFYDEGFKIDNDQFLLSHPKASPLKELEATINLFLEAKEICRFPARYEFLLRTGLIEEVSKTCPELDEYREKAPAFNFAYVLADESLNSITGMMGHGFLVSAGETSQGLLRKHSYTFFTEIDDRNPISLIRKAFVTGMSGHFALRPYDQHFQEYNAIERRNIWEADLDLSRNAITRLHDVLWELRDVHPDYLFQDFNCATLTLYSLATIEPDLLKKEPSFVTPVDVYRTLQREQLIVKSTLFLPPNSTPRSLPTVPHKRLEETSMSVTSTQSATRAEILVAGHRLRSIIPSTTSFGSLSLGKVVIDTKSQKLVEVTPYAYTDIRPASGSISSAISLSWGDFRYDTKENNSLNAEYLAGKSVWVGPLVFSVLGGAGIKFESIKPYVAAQTFIIYPAGRGMKFAASSSYRKQYNGKHRWESRIALSKRIGQSVFGTQLEQDRINSTE